MSWPSTNFYGLARLPRPWQYRDMPEIAPEPSPEMSPRRFFTVALLVKLALLLPFIALVVWKASH